MIDEYYRLERLPEDVKKAYGIRSKQRFDCTHKWSANKTLSLSPIVSGTNQLYCYFSPTDAVKRSYTQNITADFSLTNSSINLTSVFTDKTNKYGYGHANNRQYLGKSKAPNPLYHCRGNGYLFIISTNVVEVFVLYEKRSNIEQLFARFIAGDFDSKIETVRKESSVFYNYTIPYSNQ